MSYKEESIHLLNLSTHLVRPSPLPTRLTVNLWQHFHLTSTIKSCFILFIIFLYLDDRLLRDVEIGLIAFLNDYSDSPFHVRVPEM